MIDARFLNSAYSLHGIMCFLLLCWCNCIEGWLVVEDIGEVIPFAKKSLSSSAERKVQNNSEVVITLKAIWPEPKWIEMLDDGVEHKVIATIYGIYHSLVKKPHRRKLCICGIWTSDDMWDKAFVEVVGLIRSGCENAVSMKDIERLKVAFKEKYPEDTNTHYKQYAAGVMTKRSFRRVFHGDDYSERYTRLLPYLDFPATVNPKKIKLFPIQFKERNDPSVLYYRLCEVNKRSYSFMKELNGKENRFSSYACAADFLNSDLVGTFSVKPKSNEKPYNPKKPTGKLRSVGEHYQRAPEELMSHFGFRGIQFGNYLPNKERVSFVSNTHYALTMLSELLGIPKNWIGGGDLGLSFGARGHGFASAHYEPEQRVINLTRFNGAGSIAHEWMHSWDARLMKKYTGQEGLLSDHLIKNGSQYMNENSKSLAAFIEIVKSCTQPSEYVSSACRISGQSKAPKYWNKPCELVARAFEAYVQDSLMLCDFESDWLAFGTLESNYEDMSKHPYPTSYDRARINEVFSWNLPIVFSK